MDSKQSTLYGKDAIDAAIKKGNINIAGTMNMEVMDLNEESREAQILHAENIRKYETKKRARAIVVPTSIEDVKSKLRELQRPVTLFGEGPADRRERLREVIASMGLNDEELKKIQEMINQPSAVVSESSTMDVVSSASHSVTQTTSTSDVTTTYSNATGQSKTTQKEVVYTAASEELISARKFIAEYSFPRAHDRLLHIRSIREDDQKQLSENKMVSELYKNSRSLTLNSSQYGDERPMSTIRYSPYGNILATGSFNSTVKLWDAYTLDNLSILHGHEERITSISWHPNAFNESSGSTTANNTSTTYGLLATTSASTTCNIYKVDVSRNTDEMDISTHNNNIKNQSSHNQSSASSSISINHTLIQQLHGHQQGISSCEFHPSGRYIGTSSYDYTWHLYDVETGSELLLQDGHSKECATINFQHDGALVCTSDYAGVVLVWDLRSGQQVQSFQGHVKKITSTCFHPNGFQIVSGGTDNTARIWDLRKRKCAYVIPAHLNILSDLSLSASGELLATSSFDGTIKVWGMRDYRLLQTLKGHEGKVMSCDFSCDEKHLVSAGFDKTIKMWSHKDEY